jgi:hypothetical protein
MARVSRDVIVRKLPLPLQIKMGNGTVITDGFFYLTCKEAREVKIASVSEDGYATIEIFPSPKVNSGLDIAVAIEQDTFLGVAMSKSKGSGKDIGQYKYYRRLDGSLYAVTSGKRSRKLQLGKPTDRNGRIFAVARVIKDQFQNGEFSKKELIPFLSKRLSHGQMLKALLDIMHLEGYLVKKEVSTRGKLREIFVATDKLRSLVFPVHLSSLEQA